MEKLINVLHTQYNVKAFIFERARYALVYKLIVGNDCGTMIFFSRKIHCIFYEDYEQNFNNAFDLYGKVCMKKFFFFVNSTFIIN